MKIVSHDRYGPPEVLRVQEREKPVPKANELLIKVHATTVTAADSRLRSMRVPLGFGHISRLVMGISGPRQGVLGTEFSGEVVAMGAAVQAFKVGDRVFGSRGTQMGCHAEFVCIAHDAAVVAIPDGLSYAQAAVLSFGGTTALTFFRMGKLARDDKILIVGASGCVGAAAVQLAKHRGAHVTGVCSGANAELVKSLGADVVIDYTVTDFTQTGDSFDVIMDTVGSAPFARCKTALAPRGRLLMVAATLPQMLMIPWYALTGTRRAVAGVALERAEDLRTLATLAQEGHFTPFIDRHFAMADIVQAHAYVDTGRKRGNVVIDVVPA